MTMHEHDQEIIMALAAGSLDPEAVARAATGIASCPECSRDLEMQRIAIDALSEAPRAYLTAAESARLHDQLHRELKVTTPEPSRTRTSVAWSRWAGLAFGAAAAFLAVFFVLPAMLGGGNDDSGETVAFEEVAEDGGADGRSATTAAGAVPSAESPQMNADDLGGAVEMAAEPTTTTAAAETTGAPETIASPETTAAPADEALELEYLVEGELSEELLGEIIDQLTADAGFFLSSDATARTLRPDWPVCLESPRLSSIIPEDATPQIVGTLVDDTGMEHVLVAITTTSPESTTLAAITVPPCEVFATVPQEAAGE